MTNYILDTDHISLHLRGHEPIRHRLLTTDPKLVSISIVSAEEILRGRLGQIRRARNGKARISSYYWLEKTLAYFENVDIQSYDSKAENYFGIFCRQKIRIGSQDLKIAAIALSCNAILVSRNLKDFEKVPGLTIENWAD